MSVVGAKLWDCGKNPPPKRIVDGVTIKWTAMPWISMLDRDGNVRRIALSNGAAHRDANSFAARRKLAVFARNGGVPYLKCLMGTDEHFRWVPKDLKEIPACSADQTGKEPCPHIVAMEERRKAATADRRAKEVESHKSPEERRYELAKIEHDATMAALSGKDSKPKKATTGGKA